MSPAVDPMVRLALALSSSRGAFAALLGSGLSAAAGVPTGRQIVADLISKVAALEGTALGDDPFVWYRTRFGEEPDYSKLLEELAASPTQRSELLRQYFEPTDEQRRQGRRVPGAAHHALARLAARGYISVFLTTNFDRLLEQALERAGVAPTVLSTPDSLEGTGPLGRNRCTVIKLNGDYLDTRINTPAELDDYHPSMEKLLDRVLDEYGLIVCGWSADWDTALRRAFERSTTRRYATFWAARRPPTGEAARLFELRRAELVTIKDADTLFTELVAKLAALDEDSPAPTGPPPAAATNLPARTASFIGRKTELADITARLKDPAVRLLTRLLPLRQVARPGAEELESVAQLVPQRLRGQEPQSGGRELDSQRQAVEPPANFCNGGGIVVGQLKVRPHSLRPIEEELRRFIGFHLRSRDLPRADRRQ